MRSKKWWKGYADKVYAILASPLVDACSAPDRVIYFDIEDNEQTQMLDHALLCNDVVKLISDANFDTREHFIICRRFGFDGEGGRSLQEVGDEIGITKEAVKQTQARALRKLRHPFRSRHMRDWITYY